jgi:hypothetical protein
MLRKVVGVFPSSTVRDLAAYRDAVHERLTRTRIFLCIRQEGFGAQDAGVVEFCRTQALGAHGGPIGAYKKGAARVTEKLPSAASLRSTALSRILSRCRWCYCCARVSRRLYGLAMFGSVSIAEATRPTTNRESSLSWRVNPNVLSIFFNLRVN